MSYELEIADDAVADLERLFKSLPAGRQEEAIEGVEAELEKLAANPLLAPKVHLGRPAYRFHFKAGGTGYHWAATFVFSEDESRIVITHVYRQAL